MEGWRQGRIGAPFPILPFSRFWCCSCYKTLEMRLWTHLMWIAINSGAYFLLGLWGVSMSLQTFGVGAGVQFTHEQLRNSEVGDALLQAYLVPARLMGWDGKGPFLFCAFVYGALTYISMQVFFR